MGIGELVNVTGRLQLTGHARLGQQQAKSKKVGVVLL